MRTQVGPYRIDEVLGQGAMGVVYAAHDERLDRAVAIKTLSQTEDELSRARLLREARAAAGMTHPGICQVFDVVEESGELWVAMELLEGRTLMERLTAGRPRVREAIQIGLGILAPLEYLHGRGLVHRDLKPSNIFLTPHGVKLLDFSLTVGHAEKTDTRLTQDNTIVGTPHYMAPEQWRARQVSPQTDLFACGAILYEMLSGEYAFPGEDPVDVFHACVYEEPPPLTGPAGIEELDAVIRTALAKPPDQRHESARTMSEALATAHDRYRNASHSAPAADEATAEQILRFIALPFRVLRPDPDVDFLADSLPEAIGAALSGLKHLVVRSTGLVESGANVDLKRLAKALKVDYALRGSLLSAGSRLRLSAQLVEVPEGTVVWTLQEEVPMGDLFELQDDLARRVVEGLALPLSARERAQLAQDVPANARAYELYLRALHHQGEAFTRTANMTVRDLLRSCLDADPDFAPAWARYGRVCRKIAKFGLDTSGTHLGLAREAFERALELNPDSPLAHNYYAFFELEQRGEPVAVMLRLLSRVGDRVADANLYAALVAACRFCGLLEASLAAHHRCVRLDPSVSTSVHHTYFQLGRMDEVEGRDFLHALRGDDQHAQEVIRKEAASPVEGVVSHYVNSVLAAVEDRPADCRAAYQIALEHGLDDPEFSFYFARALSRAGLTTDALEAMERVIRRGFYCVVSLESDPWLEPLRDAPDFETLVADARAGRRRAVEAYRDADGEKLLGAAES